MKVPFHFFSVSMLLAGTSICAEDDLSKYFEMSIAQLLQVEVTGSTKTQQSQLDVPASVTVFTEQEISRLGVSSLLELMNYAPGFQSRRDGESSTKNKTTARGHNAGRHVLILLDGHRLNSEYVGGINAFFDRVPLDNIKRVEFIRGAGSAIYGSNAFSGVINLVSNRDKTAFALRFSENAYQGSAQVSMNESDFSFSIFAKGIKDTGVKYTSLSDTLNNGQNSGKDPYNSFDLQLFTEYKGLSLSYIHHNKDLEDFYILQELGRPNTERNNFDSVKVGYNLEVNDALTSNLSLGYHELKSDIKGNISGQNGLDGFLYPSGPLKGKAKAKEKTYSVEWFNEYKLEGSDSFIFGAEYRTTNVGVDLGFNYDIVNTSFPTPFPYDASYFNYAGVDDKTREIYGVYGQYQAQFYEDFLVTLGLRYDDYSDFGSSFNPRVALVYKALENTSVKLLYSEAFRAPSISQLYLTNNPVVQGNSDLKSEKLKSYEFILVQQYDKHAFNISYYENHMTDLITDTQLTGGKDSYENNGNEVYKGIDLEYLGEVLEDFTVRSTYSYIIQKPDSAFDSSDHIASLILNYNPNKFNLNLGTYYHHRIEKGTSSLDGQMPSYTIVDAKVSYKVYKNTLVYIQVKNALDKDYLTPENGGGVTILEVENRGRESFLGLEVNF